MVRRFLDQASYAHAVCWIGACLAHALQDAHSRGLVHMDVKPANVLLAADGQPMLLDFHLAREPIRADGPRPAWLGGTPGWMSPEQRTGMSSLGGDRSVPIAVDGRSDIYSLGLLLYEALGGSVDLQQDGPRPRLDAISPQCSTGLADLVHE